RDRGRPRRTHARQHHDVDLRERHCVRAAPSSRMRTVLNSDNAGRRLGVRGSEHPTASSQPRLGGATGPGPIVESLTNRGDSMTENHNPESNHNMRRNLRGEDATRRIDSQDPADPAGSSQTGATGQPETGRAEGTSQPAGAGQDVAAGNGTAQTGPGPNDGPSAAYLLPNALPGNAAGRAPSNSGSAFASPPTSATPATGKKKRRVPLVPAVLVGSALFVVGGLAGGAIGASAVMASNGSETSQGPGGQGGMGGPGG